MIKKYKNLVKIMGLPGTTMDKEATKQMGKYAKHPKNYLKDVNELVSAMAKEERAKNGSKKTTKKIVKYYILYY